MSNHFKTSFIGFLIFLFTSFTYGKEVDNSTQPSINTEEPPKIGNFALPLSQQLGPLLSFGQNIIGKNQTQFALLSNNLIGTRQHTANISPSLLYQITNDLSVFFNLPIAASYQEDHTHSAGLGDALAQFEYAFYTKQTTRFSDQATVVANMSFPSGSAQKQPPTGSGAPTFFLGTTLNHTSVDWFGFTSNGVTQTTSHDGIKFGDEFIYQFGLGRNFLTRGTQWMFAGLVEIDGQYTQRNKLNNITDPNSGGNIVYITPSLWFSSKQLILQLGMGFPAVQNLFGEQKENHYLIAGAFTWTF